MFLAVELRNRATGKNQKKLPLHYTSFSFKLSKKESLANFNVLTPAIFWTIVFFLNFFMFICSLKKNINSWQ